jgi:hypothetical protein
MAVSVAAVVLGSVLGGEKRRVFTASSALDCGSDRPDDAISFSPTECRSATSHIRAGSLCRSFLTNDT